MAAKFVCSACNFTQALLDKDVGKRAKCPKCAQIGQVVSNDSSASAVASQAPQAKIIHEHKAVEPASVAHGIRAGSGSESIRPAEAPPPRTKGGWFYYRGDERVGPVGDRELDDLARDGILRGHDKVWKEGMRDWARADEYFECWDDEPRPRRRRRRRSRGGQNDAGKVCGILACVFGGIAFIFCPLFIGGAGIVLGIVSVCISKDKTLGTIGLVVSVAGTIIGIILGILVMNSFGRMGF